MLPRNDLQDIFTQLGSRWERFRDKRIFMSGGTGFVGAWLVESFLFANHALALNAKLVILSRNPHTYLNKNAWLKQESAIECFAGDIRDFEFPKDAFDFVIHGAAEPLAGLSSAAALEMFETTYLGTQRILKFCQHSKAKKLLFLSSGAVYGTQPNNLSRIPENYLGAPAIEEARAAYGEGKRVAEWLCFQAAQAFNFEVNSARCFAFVGPKLPLSGHYAVGNFIRDALDGKDIYLKGNGLAVRSYMYAADLAVWLWSILFEGKNLEAYNVGSEVPTTVKDLAEKVAALATTPCKVIVQGNVGDSLAGDLYIPSTLKIREHLGVTLKVNESEALSRTVHYYQQNKEAE